MINCKFSYQQEIKVTKGFYRGFKGIVQELKEIKGVLSYVVKLSNNKTITLEENNLRTLILGFM